MRMEFIESPVTPEQLEELAAENFGTMVKGVVDIRRRVLALGGELNADGEALLLQNGSAQADLWGFNIHTGWDREGRCVCETPMSWNLPVW